MRHIIKTVLIMAHVIIIRITVAMKIQDII